MSDCTLGVTLSGDHRDVSWLLLPLMREERRWDRGVLTLTRYVYVPAFWGAFLQKIWYSGWWIFIRDERVQTEKFGVFGANSCKEPQFGQNWVLFYSKWYTDGWVIGQKLVWGKLNFPGSAGTFWQKYPPPRDKRWGWKEVDALFCFLMIWFQKLLW